MTQRWRTRIGTAIAAGLLALATGGCSSVSGGSWFGRQPNSNLASANPAQGQPAPGQPAPGQPAPAKGQPGAQPPGAAANSGVAPASYQQPKYVPPPSLRPEDLLQNEDLDYYAGEKKSWLESVTDKYSPGKLGKGIKKAFGRGPNELLAKRKFEEGEALFKEKKYKEAAKCFSVTVDRWPDSALEEDALYMLAESYFFDDRYPKANDSYERLLKKYENTRYLTDISPRLFAIARYWDLAARRESHWYPNLTDKTRPALDATGYAVKAYSSVHSHDPNGPLADDAKMAIGNSYFLRNRYEEASMEYEVVRKMHANSDHIKEAHLLGIRAKLRSYLGPQYEVKPLDDANQLIETTITQFPYEMLGDERERLYATKQLIRQEKAQREFQSGEYYYKIKYYRAARYYYLQTIREYADTPFAKMAEDRLEETKNYPPVPYDYFGWLKKLVPESDKNL